MVDISSGNKKISITVSSTGNKGNVSTSPDMSMFYTERSREWAISEKIVNNEDYSSKYYANESKKQAQISINKTTEVVNSGNEALSNIDNAKTGALTDIEINKTNAITDIVNQETLSVNNVNTVGATQVNNVNSAGTTQINLAKEQVTLATNQANIATEKANIATTQAGIATAKTTEVVESGNTALSNIATAKSNALSEINTTGAGYVENAERYAQNALTSANNASASEANALSYKNSALESSQTATEQANIAVANANKAVTSATNAKTSETNARSSEVRCEEILSRLGTVIKIKGRVDSVGDLPLGDNLDGDAYLVGGEGLDSYPEYYWYQDHWEFLGTTGTSLSWGLISGDISNQTDLQTALNNKQDKGNYALKSEIPTKTSQLTNDSGFINNDSTFVHKTGNETIGGVKTFSSNPIITGTGININNSNDVVIQKQGTNFLRKASNGCIILSGTNTIYVRPNGDTNTTGQVQIATDGTVTGTKFVGSLKGNVTGNVSGSSGSCTGNSATATKATQDGNGNNIVNTYATKTSLNTKANTSLSNLTEDGIKVIKDNASYQPPLLSTMWSDHLLNDMSWLRADTFSWQDGNTYSQAYNELLSEYNNPASTTETEGSITFKRTLKGYKIALANQETAIDTKYTTDGIAWYYILDTTNKKFKLPRTKFGFEGLRTSVGDDIEAGLPNITGAFALQNDRVVSRSGAFNTVTASTRYTKGIQADGSGQGGVDFNASSSNSIYGKSSTVQPPATQMYLYFYVGEFTQTAEAQTAGLKAELLNGKVDKSDLAEIYPVVKTYVNGTSGYRIWSDGYCVQWGRSTVNQDSSVTITFLKPFMDTSYYANWISCSGTNTAGSGTRSADTLTTTTMRLFNGQDVTMVANWQASGYLAEGWNNEGVS